MIHIYYDHLYALASHSSTPKKAKQKSEQNSPCPHPQFKNPAEICQNRPYFVTLSLPISICSAIISALIIWRLNLNGYSDIMSQSNSSSGDKRRRGDRDRSRSEDRMQTCKLFITNLDGKSETKELQDELRRLFEKCGTVESIVAKRNKNSEYCFAFAEMKDHAAAAECVKNYDQSSLNGKQIKVEFQDDTKRRKDSNKGCYNCGKMGHFARECHSSRPDERDRSRHGRGRYSRSRSEDSDRHKKPKRRHRSDSSDRGRSRSPKSKKDRKNRSRDRDEKRSKKKHKKSHSSDS